MWQQRAIFRPFLKEIPDVANYVLALTGAAVPFVSEMTSFLEKRKWVRWVTAFVFVSLASLGLVSNHLQRAASEVANQALTGNLNNLTGEVGELKQQVKTLALPPAPGSTANDIGLLRGDMRAGFDSILKALKTLGAKVEAVKPPQPGATAASTHLTWGSREVVSPVSAYAHALQVIVRPDAPLQPTQLQLNFDGPIEQVDYFTAGKAMSVQMAVQKGKTANNMGYVLCYEFPPLSPDAPLVFTVLSKETVHFKGITRADC